MPTGLSDMAEVGQQMERAIVLGASGGIGGALVDTLVAGGTGQVFAASRVRPDTLPKGVEWLPFDLDDEGSNAAAAEAVGAPIDCVIVASGVLSLPDGSGPERSYKQVEADAMARVLHLNTIGPALVAKHFLPLLPRDRRAVFAALSARVGSIGDNRIGGWHSYRASKAALNMLIRNYAIELGRTHKQAICVGLHPGTVDTALSEPFQSNLPKGQLTAPADAARDLMGVLDQLSSEDSGHVFDWAGKQVEF